MEWGTALERELEAERAIERDGEREKESARQVGGPQREKDEKG